MLRRTSFFLYITHSPRAVPFQLSSADAVAAIKKKYDQRWFGADTQYMDFNRTTAEMVPYFFCRGDITGTYAASVDYTTHGSDAGGKMTAKTNTVKVSPQAFRSGFHPNETQVYAGYKFSNRRLSKAMVDPGNVLNMRKVVSVDMSQTNINLFEMSTTTLCSVLDSVVLKQAEAAAEAQVKSFHPDATRVRVNFTDFHVKIEEVFPVFLPCYVSDVKYDGGDFTMYTHGGSGVVSGPYLLSGLALGRTATVAVVALAVLLHPIKLYGLAVGSVAAVPAYYAAYYAAKMIPRWIRDRNRNERLRRQAKFASNDASGYRPDAEARRRVEDEKNASQERERRYEQHTSSSQSSSSSSAIRDPKGYYRRLGLRGHESVNEIRQAFRQLVMKHHPDAGGKEADMAAINEAYRTLRDPAERAQYDRSG